MWLVVFEEVGLVFEAKSVVVEMPNHRWEPGEEIVAVPIGNGSKNPLQVGRELLIVIFLVHKHLIRTHRSYMERFGTCLVSDRS